jgi:hypothetical protein
MQGRIQRLAGLLAPFSMEMSGRKGVTNAEFAPQRLGTSLPRLIPFV